MLKADSAGVRYEVLHSRRDSLRLSAGVNCIWPESARQGVSAAAAGTREAGRAQYMGSE